MATPNSKNVYFAVTTRKVVKAPNQAEAKRLAARASGGKVNVSRISANTVRAANDDIVAIATA